MLLLNMGLTLLGLGRHREALERCQRFELRVPKRNEQKNNHRLRCKKRMSAWPQVSAKTKG